MFRQCSPLPQSCSLFPPPFSPAFASQRPDQGRGAGSARNRSPIFYLRNFNNWIKSLLINTYCQRGSSVLDLCSGKGGDLLKWEKCWARHVVFADHAQQSVMVSLRRYNELVQDTRRRQRVFPAIFIVADCVRCRVAHCLLIRTVCSLSSVTPASSSDIGSPSICHRRCNSIWSVVSSRCTTHSRQRHARELCSSTSPTACDPARSLLPPSRAPSDSCGGSVHCLPVRRASATRCSMCNSTTSLSRFRRLELSCGSGVGGVC